MSDPGGQLPASHGDYPVHFYSGDQDLAVKGDSDGSGTTMRRFSSALASAREAREFVAAALLSRLPGPQGIDATIVIAELAANVVRHARTGFTVSVSHLPRAVRIAVRDHAPLGDSPPTARPGHGLHMVAQVATRWAIEPLSGGKVV